MFKTIVTIASLAAAAYGGYKLHEVLTDCEDFDSEELDAYTKGYDDGYIDGSDDASECCCCNFDDYPSTVVSKDEEKTPDPLATVSREKASEEAVNEDPAPKKTTAKKKKSE